MLFKSAQGWQLLKASRSARAPKSWRPVEKKTVGKIEVNGHFYPVFETSGAVYYIGPKGNWIKVFGYITKS